jgi:competence protein ComEA
MRRFSYAIAVALLPMLLVASPARALAQDKPAARPAAAAAPAAIVNLNTATLAQLQTLPGIGARTAQAILDHRQKNGGFKKIEELMNVKGIGEKSFLKLKPMVVVSPEKPEKTGDRH